jgi:predicted MFS family arabinose efflux permease
MISKLLQTYLAAYEGLPRFAWLLSLVVFVNRSGSMVLFFMTLYLTQKLNLSIAAAGQMISIYGLGALVGSYAGGWLSDVIGTRKVQSLSLILSGVGFIILNHIISVVPIAILMFLLALVSEAFRPANAAAMAEICPPLLRPRAFALNRLAINLGVTIGPAVGGFLARMDYGYLFWVDAVTCFAASIILWMFYHPPAHHVQSADTETVSPYHSPLKDKIYLMMLSLVFSCALIFVQLFNSWPVYLKEIYHLLEHKIGLLLTLNAILVVLFEMPLIHQIEKSNHLKIIAIGSLFLGVGFALLPFGSGFIYGAFTVIIWTIGEILVFPLIAGFIANRADEKSRGKYLGMFNLSFSLALFIGPATGTAVYQSLGPDLLWWSCGLLGILMMTGFLFINKLLSNQS